VKSKDAAHRRIALLAMGALLLVVVAGMGAALNPLSSSKAGSPSPSSLATHADLTASLSVLRRPATASDALPSRLGRALETVASGPLESGLSRQATATPKGVAVYLVPTVSGGACFVDSNLSELFCATAAQVQDGSATASTACSPTLGSNTVEIGGVLPDGATNPTVLLANGESKPLDVAGNTYLMQFARTSPLPTKIQWSSTGGLQSIDTAVPGDAATIDCLGTSAGGGTGTGSGAETGTVHYNEG
jgi:hypothetical protein